MPSIFERLATVVRRVRFHLHRERFERELAEEMRFHVDMKARDHEQAGMSPDAALDAAQRRFGNRRRIQEQTGDIMAVGWVDSAAQDARYALRSLRKSPAFSVVAVASLALGIGATTAVFTLVNAMLLRPPPFPQPDRLVVTFQTVTPGVLFAADSMPWTYNRYVRLREMVPAFGDAGYSSWDEYNLRRTGLPSAASAQPAERVRAELVTTSLFSTLGATAMLGRTIAAADSVPSATGAVAVLSEPLWRRQFGADSAVLGTTAVMNDLPVTIIGVMPASFTGIRENAEMWVPIKAMSQLGPPGPSHKIEGGMGVIVARLNPGVSVAIANAQVQAAARQLLVEIPPPSFGTRKAEWSGGVVAFTEARQHPLIRPLLLVLSIAVAGVMLIVCANIAGLLLARARARESELAVRVALGAGRGRLARQMLTESVVLALLGGVPGVLIAYAGATLLARLRPTLPPNFILLRSVDLLQGASLVPDWRVLTFVTGLTTIVGILFGAVPAVVASRASIAELIKVGGSRTGTVRARGRRALVVGQVALATTLLVGAGLMVRSFRALLRSDIGFDPASILMMNLSGGDSVAKIPARRAEMLARIAALPGVEAAAAYNCAPLGSDCMFMPVTQVNARAVERGEFPPLEVHAVTRDFLRVLRTPLRAGRTFDAREKPDTVTAALLNETAARLLFRGESPIGQRVSTFTDDATTVEVIGVVADVKYETIDGPTRPAIYFDEDQFSDEGGSVIIARTRRNPAQAVPAIRRLIAESDPTVGIYGVTTGDGLMARASSSTRFVTLLLAGFGLSAALLAALGVYGVLAYLVSQRQREFGIRMAIGALPSSVLALVVRQGVVLTVVGLVLGVAGAFAATGLLSRFLFGVQRADVATYAAIVLLVGLTGVLAALVPALRATKVDPVTALRQ
ncbi:MAG TPA: ABC transporter permease [Gemmatimonadaceae bacterium]|nr:ABC transporter permease [Gemmatimonadaceae bacterium]